MKTGDLWWLLRALVASVAFQWPVITVVGGFLAVGWWIQQALVPPPTPPMPERNAAHAAYEAAIAEAAVKRPGYAVRLRTIPTTSTTVNVVSFGPSKPIDAKAREFELWVSLPDELRDACKGAANPVRRLQEILGLPPVDAPNHVIKELQVQRSGLIRPCIAGGDLSNPYCSFEMLAPRATAPNTLASFTGNSAPQPSPSASAVASGANGKAPNAIGAAGAPGGSGAPVPDSMRAGTDSNSAFEDLYFLTAQMWNTYRHAFPTGKLKTGDYPFSGYPFTGMGWTYDWSGVPNHIGVSEFVIKRTVAVTIISEKPPAEFCAP